MKNSYLKKVVALIITIAMIIPMLPVVSATASSQFVDFPTGWSYEAMTAAVSNGLINGRTHNTIEPTGDLTRAEMATIINRAFGATKTKDISSYSDVKPSDWFYTEIAKAVNMQTFQGDTSGLMRPNDSITREEVFAVIARALVLETSDYSALSSHPDGYAVSPWAKPYASILSAKNYINGDENGYLNPKSNITREEFAQIMHNIIKTYYVSAGTYSKAGKDSSLIRTSGVILRDVTIEGDLIIGDGVGYGSVVLENVIIKGRLLARGGEDSVRLVNTKVGENVVVKDVNGVVHFDNYKSEDAFKNINEITKATFKGDNYSISIGGSSSSSSKSYTISVTGAGINISDSVVRGSTYTLPTPNMSTYPGFAGWRDNYGIIKNAGDSVIVTEDNTYVAVFTYKIKYYKQNLAKNAFIPDESLTVTRYDTKDKIVSASRSDKQRTFTGFTYSEPDSVTSTTVNTSGTAEIKLYYTRNDIEISYSFVNGGAFTDGQPHNTTVVYGSDFTLPLATEVENGFDILIGWNCNGTTYAPGETVTIEGYDPEGGWVFIAIWETTVVYRVDFMAYSDGNYAVVGSTSVPENTKVPQSFIDSLPPLWEVTGYVKDSRISPVLYGSGNEYTHTVKFGWFYNPTTNIWERFSNNVAITDAIVDSSGVLTVKEMSPKLSIYADIEKIGTAFDFQRYYEPKVVTADSSGNITVTGTRAMDTFKDYLWDAFSARTTSLQIQLQSKIETAGEKAFVKLRQRGLLDADNNILPVDLFVRYSQIIGEAELEDYIVDNAKETLKNNDELKDAIFEYFEHMASSSNPADRDEMKSLFTDTIHLVIDTDPDAKDEARDICADMFSHDSFAKTAPGRFLGYSVTVTDADLASSARVSAIKWFKELANSDTAFRNEIVNELISAGYNPSDVNAHIVPYIEANIVSIIQDKFGYCPVNFDSLTGRELIIEVVMHLFDTDEAKRDQIIAEAVEEIVESGDLDDFEYYVDHAIDFLENNGRLDGVIDEIIELKYRPTLDTMVYQLINNENFVIDPQHEFILSAFEMQVLDYTFDDLAANVPDKVFRIYPRARLEQIFNNAYNNLLAKITEGKQALARGENATIPSGLTFVVNPVDDIYVILRNRFVELVDSRASANYYYSDNEYLQEFIRLTEVQNIFETGTGVGTGYAIKEYRDYYDLILKLAIIGDDAMVWYTEELSQDELDQLILDYEDLFVKYANLLADIVGDYADTGSLPSQVDNNIVNAIRNEIVSRLGSVHDKVLNWYKASPFNKEYSEDDYAKLRKVVRKAFGKINATTDEAIELANKAYTLIDNKFEGLADVDQLTQIDADTYEVTIKGKTIRVERIDSDTYKLTVSGKTINISRLENGNKYEITKGSDIIRIYREIAE